MAVLKTQDIKLSALLKEKHINLSLKGSDKKQILRELAEIVAKSAKLKDKKAFLSAVIKREKLGSTGIGNGVAIPHAKIDEVKGFVLGFGRREGGIDFEALDGEKTFLFFVLAAPKDEVGGHLKILAKIAHIVQDKFIIEQLKRAKDKYDALKIISMFDKKL